MAPDQRSRDLEAAAHLRMVLAELGRSAEIDARMLELLDSLERDRLHDDERAELRTGLLADLLQAHGFDANWAPTALGKTLEDVIDLLASF